MKKGDALTYPFIIRFIVQNGRLNPNMHFVRCKRNVLFPIYKIPYKNNKSHL